MILGSLIFGIGLGITGLMPGPGFINSLLRVNPFWWGISAIGG